MGMFFTLNSCRGRHGDGRHDDEGVMSSVDAGVEQRCKSRMFWSSPVRQATKGAV